MDTNSTPPRQNRVGVGVTSSLWGITFLTLILLSNALPPSQSPNGGNVRRRVRGTVGGGRGVKLFNISSPNYYPHVSSSTPFPTPTTTFDLDESKRLLRLESASPLSYLYRYRAPRTTSTLATPTPTQPSHFSSRSNAQPRVLLRLNGQSGVISRRVVVKVPKPDPITTTTPPPQLSPPQDEKSNQKSDNTFPHPQEFKNIVEEADYPYHYYLDFDEVKAKGQGQGGGQASSVVGEYLYPQPSEHLKPFALPETQSSLWNDFLQNANPHGQLSPLPPPLLPSYLNEINDSDNYTIPSLRDYKFPGFKTITTTTKKPPKSNNFLNPYEFFSEEDLENVADLDFDSDHSKYFVKTKPRDVSSSVANLYNSFYYEPPSYSTKSQPLPVNAKFPEHRHLIKNDDDEPQPQKSQENNNPKWTRIHGGDELNYNFFNNEDGTLVTFPMSATPSPTMATMAPASEMSSYLPVDNPQLPLPLPPTTTTSNPLNLSGYYYKTPANAEPEAEQRNDVATAESIAILASKSSSLVPSLSFNLIPDDHVESSPFLHKDGRNVQQAELDTAIISSSSSTTTPTPTPAKIDFSTPTPTQDYTTTPSSGSDQDTTNIPGMPGIDYPVFDEIPVTGFDCAKQRYKGFFADIETKCQVWHYCDFADGHSSFLCPNGTLFSQVLLTCDWWFNVNCIQSQQLYVLNERLYRYIKPPKPSFPEDYHGPGVDLWLQKQLELGLLPKIKKRGKHLQLQLEKPVPTTLKERVEVEMGSQNGDEGSSSDDHDKEIMDNPNATPTTTTTEYPPYSNSHNSEEKSDQE